MRLKMIKLSFWIKSLTVIAVSPVWAYAEPVDLREQVKAAYLYNILQFVTFPEYAFLETGTLKVCILGKDKFGQMLNQIDAAKTAQAEVNIVRLESFSDSRDLQECDVLYVVETERSRIESIMEAVDSKRTLTISEFSPFIEHGGLIELFEQDNRIRFRINEQLVRNTDYQLAAQLIQLGVRK